MRYKLRILMVIHIYLRHHHWRILPKLVIRKIVVMWTTLHLHLLHPMTHIEDQEIYAYK